MPSQYTPPTRLDSAVELSRVGGVNYTRRQSWPSLQIPMLLVTSKDIVTSLLKKLLMSIKRRFTHGRQFPIVDWIHRQSSWACELCSHRRRRRDATRHLRRRCVLGWRLYLIDVYSTPSFVTNILLFRPRTDRNTLTTDHWPPSGQKYNRVTAIRPNSFGDRTFPLLNSMADFVHNIFVFVSK